MFSTKLYEFIKHEYIKTYPLDHCFLYIVIS